MIQITYKICVIRCSIHNYTLTSKCLCPFCNAFVTTGMKPKHIRSVLFENSPGFHVFISRNYDVGQSKLYTLWSFASKARIPFRQRNQLTTSRCKLQTLLNCWRDFFIMSFYPPLDHAGHGSVLDGVFLAWFLRTTLSMVLMSVLATCAIVFGQMMIYSDATVVFVLLLCYSLAVTMLAWVLQHGSVITRTSF